MTTYTSQQGFPTGNILSSMQYYLMLIKPNKITKGPTVLTLPVKSEKWEAS